MDLKNLWPKKDAPPIEKALKFIEKYKSKKIVLKYGGQVMASDQLPKLLLKTLQYVILLV